MVKHAKRLYWEFQAPDGTAGRAGLRRPRQPWTMWAVPRATPTPPPPPDIGLIFQSESPTDGLLFSPLSPAVAVALGGQLC